MTEEIEAMIDNTLELSAVFVKLTHEKALVSKRDAEGKKYTGEDGCGDPWMGMSISSLDENAFKPFEGLEMGDEVIVSLTPVE